MISPCKLCTPKPVDNTFLYFVLSTKTDRSLFWKYIIHILLRCIIWMIYYNLYNNIFKHYTYYRILTYNTS